MAAGEAGIIGKGIQIRGNLSGAEDLIIEGRIEGHVTLQNHLTVESPGIVVADIEAKNLTINGQMNGNIDVHERVLISSSATVLGNVRAPRVVIEDGARFRGHIEMDVPLPDDI